MILAALLLSSASYAQDKRDAPGPRPEANREQKGGPAPPPGERNVGSKGYRANCDKPKDRDDADLCEQRRMADAAEHALVWAKRIFLLNVLQFVGVLAAAIFAAMAAFAARRTVRVMDDTAQRQLRAYVNLTGLEFLEPPGHGGKLKTRMIFGNFGQTPAYQIHSELKVIGVNGYLKEDEFDEVKLMPGGGRGDLLPSAKHTNVLVIDCPANAETLIRGGQMIIYAYGWIRYRDVFGANHVTNFRWRSDKGSYETEAVFTSETSGNEST